MNVYKIVVGLAVIFSLAACSSPSPEVPVPSASPSLSSWEQAAKNTQDRIDAENAMIIPACTSLADLKREHGGMFDPYQVAVVPSLEVAVEARDSGDTSLYKHAAQIEYAAKEFGVNYDQVWAKFGLATALTKMDTECIERVGLL